MVTDVQLKQTKPVLVFPAVTAHSCWVCGQHWFSTRWEVCITVQVLTTIALGKWLAYQNPFTLIRSKQRRELTDLSLRTNLAESMFGEFLRTPRFYVPTCRQLNPSSKTGDWGHLHCSFVVWTSCLNSLTLAPSLHLSLNSETWVNNTVDHQSSKTGQRGRRLLKPWIGWWNISNSTS